jgi:hypothetical protein
MRSILACGVNLDLRMAGCRGTAAALACRCRYREGAPSMDRTVFETELQRDGY